MRIVCDSSTIIALERINYLWLLENLAKEILIPDAVAKEIKRKKDVNLPAFFIVKEAKDKSFINQKRENLHSGEVEAIALARETKTDLLILDDKKARELAEKEGLNVAGLLALLILAREKEIIKKVKPILDALKAQNFFIGEDLYIEILKLSGEME